MSNIPQLFAAITAEGATDETFLKIIIRRTIEAIALEHGRMIDIYSLSWLGSYLKSGPTLKISEADEAGAQLLFVHHDTDEHTREEVDEWHIEPFRDVIEKSGDLDVIIVPLIIEYEQETWMLADFDKLNEILGGKLNQQALNLPPELETRSNTKEVMQQAIEMANVGQTRGRGYTKALIVERLAEELDLGRLAGLPSYIAFKGEIITALRALEYLPPAT